MRILEFYGLPGSGKSSIAQLLIRKYLNAGIDVVTADDYLRIYSKKINIIRGLFCPLGFRYAFFVFIILIRLKLILNFDVVIRMIRILPLFYFYKENVSKLIIMDQAVIQQYVSAFFDYCELANEDIDIIGMIVKKYNIMPLHVIVPLKEANNRINKRNNQNHGRLDSISDENNRRRILLIQCKNFELTNQYLNSLKRNIELDNTKVLQNNLDNLDYLFSYLYS